MFRVSYQIHLYGIYDLFSTDNRDVKNNHIQFFLNKKQPE